jgi:ornithine cyclodeaminase/alanine dehydrogenase-like protein (mu-crystallin family)
MDTLVLSVQDLRRLVEEFGLADLMDRMIEALGTALEGFTPERYTAPARTGFSYENPELGLIEWMPAMEISKHLATIKVVGYHPNNPVQRVLPTILSSVVQYDTESGHLLALMDATLLTALRTGAASAVASRILARPDSRVLALIGCGAQSVSQVHALSRCFPLEQIRLFDTNDLATASFAARIGNLELGDVTCKRVASANDAVRGADILCTTTSVEPGAGPVFDDIDLPPSLHINAVGSDFPGKIEVPLSVLERSYICADFIEQCLLEGECQQIRRTGIDADLVELIQNPRAAHSARERISVFDSTGWALQDHVAAELLVSEARRLGLGAHVEIETSSLLDPKNPYAFLEEGEDIERLQTDFAEWSTRKRT